MSQTVDKALRILELLGEGEMRLVDLSAQLNEHKSTVQRLLATLQARGFVRQDEHTRRYTVGLRVLQLASLALADIDLRDAAHEPMRHLGDLTNETVHLAIYDEPHVVYLDKVESSFPIRMYSRIGARAESYCTGVGKAIVAYLSEYELERYFHAASFTQFTPRTITTTEELIKEIAEIRARGYAFDEQEHEEGIRCVAAPIFAFGGHVAGSISVAAPAFRRSKRDLQEFAPAIVETADRISSNLGSSKRNKGGKEGRER